MNILGIGFPELLLIFLIAFLVLGPKRMFRFSKDLGSYVRKFNSKKDEFQDLIDKEIKDDQIDKEEQYGKQDRDQPEE